MQSIQHIIIGIVVVSIIAVAYYFRRGIRSGLLKYRAQLQLRSLPEAIKAADKDKGNTGRKNMVSLSAADGSYKPFQKQLLKRVAATNKNKNNAAMTKGRQWFMSKNKRKPRIMDYDKVKEAEKKAVYVTN